MKLITTLTIVLSSIIPLSLASITCVTVGTTATATWVNAAEETCTFAAVVGSNFGNTSADGDSGDDYSCNGRCGAGCTGAALGNFYTQHCFSHDLCSYWNDASGGSKDPNCGAAYDDAVEDFVLGGVDGCGQDNPTNAVVKPTESPVCS